MKENWGNSQGEQPTISLGRKPHIWKLHFHLKILKTTNLVEKGCLQL
jgi:hypothetical protein